ncbi:uncharacterized protein CCOS01_12405 [Colletotrichum costaricense]|uniref:NACHT-NTPase and P-loop NTPases N-terminal domain-containing protein n=1 Tax=Colletotrichum costaricense TaxID=1209916 RepID=A0AAI9YMI2_9PEZI|nr:uncharacterized protein CCOS01_12405 [Colletotrichum costaricense]KAK1516856.1 hypothetical protein CCOS01_12405 [Colletotrichum costaricense]
MSGAEVLGIISAIISVIDASIQLYKAANDVSGLPFAFRQVYSRLPLVLDTLKAAENGFDDQGDSPNSREALVRLLESCENKARSLEEIFRDTISPPRISKVKKFFKAMKTVPKNGELEALSEGILADLSVLTSNYAVKFTTRQEMERLVRLLEGEPRDPGNSRDMMNNSMGSNQQYIKLDEGNQYVAIGNSMQINGPSSGTFNYNSR